MVVHGCTNQFLCKNIFQSGFRYDVDFFWECVVRIAFIRFFSWNQGDILLKSDFILHVVCVNAYYRSYAFAAIFHCKNERRTDV